MYKPGLKRTSTMALDTRRFCSMDKGAKIGTRLTACPGYRDTEQMTQYEDTWIESTIVNSFHVLCFMIKPLGYEPSRSVDFRFEEHRDSYNRSSTIMTSGRVLFATGC